MSSISKALCSCAGAILSLPLACGRQQEARAGSPEPTGSKVGVLLVNHGSRSARWRDMLLAVERSVRDELLSDDQISGVRTAFMEYTEPSIATRLKEFDREGYSDVVLVPILLTVSSHSFDDIPTIYGAKQDRLSLETMEAEGIERYPPRATVTMTPLLDFTGLLTANVLRRVKAMSTEPAEEAVVLVGYGSHAYNDEWLALFEKLGEALREGLGIELQNHAWCGHLVDYSIEPTRTAVREALAVKQRALVVPILVAVDELFQIEIIGQAVEAAGDRDRIIYKADAILPEDDLNRWVVEVARRTASSLAGRHDS